MLAAAVLFAAAAAQPAAPLARLAALEPQVAADAENLALAADYRQFAIEAKAFDRSIQFLERLAKRKGSGPNVQISLALAYVDKVPPSGDMRRLYLARDAIGALDKAIERRPTALAYFLRGRINLYFNNIIFKRIPRGLADLERALALIDDRTPPLLAGRVHASIGDGHWRLGDRAKAREAWRRGLDRYPASEELKARAASADASGIVFDALYAGTRIDTTLRGMLP